MLTEFITLQVLLRQFDATRRVSKWLPKLGEMEGVERVACVKVKEETSRWREVRCRSVRDQIQVPWGRFRGEVLWCEGFMLVAKFIFHVSIWTNRWVGRQLSSACRMGDMIMEWGLVVWDHWQPVNLAPEWLPYSLEYQRFDYCVWVHEKMKHCRSVW